jgi:hypothetical protein
MTEIRRSVEQALQKKTNANRRLHALNQLEERLNHTLADVRQALGGQAVTQSPPALLATELQQNRHRQQHCHRLCLFLVQWLQLFASLLGLDSYTTTKL